jgi:Tfp pilus assembly protein PilE
VKKLLITILIIVILAGIGYFYQSNNEKVMQNTNDTKITYMIDDMAITEKDFSEFKNKLEIDESSAVSSNFEIEPRVHGGTEVHYQAKDKTTGEIYQYSKFEMADGESKSFVITKK